MFLKRHLSVALVTTALVASSVASAGIVVVTFSPGASNAGAVGGGVIDATTPDFNAVGAQSNLTGALDIATNSGVSLYSETGRADLTSFSCDVSGGGIPGPCTSNVNVAGKYGVYALYSVSGAGAWAGTVFTAGPNPTVTFDLWADPGLDGAAGDFKLGSGALDAGALQLAFAIAAGSLAPGSSGAAVTSFTASLIYTPEPGTSGSSGCPAAPCGFFAAPYPLLIEFAVGNAGGNSLNTGYTVDAGGGVHFTTPLPGTNPGTANFTFISAAVPEPGVLSLLGIALVGLGALRTRKASTPV